MILEGFVQGLLYYMHIGIWLWILAGVICGLLFGVIPGIQGLTGLALFLPFAFVLKPEQALPFMVGMTISSLTGGTITSIVLGIPGDTPNVATIIDGFPMTKKGEGGRALGAALTSSVLGGVFPVFLALGMIPVVLFLVMAITSMDMVFVVLVGISFIAVVTTGSTIKGLISGGIGLLISLIGCQWLTGEARFTFGSTYLYDGIHLIPMILGLFALPQMFDLMKGGAIIQMGAEIGGFHHVLQGMKDVFHNWKLFLQSSLIGYIVGIIPGVGAMTAVFLAYGQAKKTSKHPELFGTGYVEGVIAPESATNAVHAGAMLPTLALGIPGSAGTAILLGGFVIMGLVPGPEMMTKHLDLSIALLISILMSCFMAAAICFPLVSYMAKIACVPGRILVPLILVAVFAGCFAELQLMQDLVVLLVFTGLGLAMERFGYSPVALFLGYVLGNLFEMYFFISLQVAGPLFFLRPISLALIVTLIGLFSFSPLKRLFRHLFKQGVTKA